MKNEKLYKGYDPFFIGNENLKVELPILGATHKNDVVSINKKSTSVIDYINYSLVLSSSRKFPFFTASNVNGSLFKKAPRDDNWRKDSRLKSAQWGSELYSAKKSDFDKGHMTKREDVQWGDTLGIARAAADSTFYYSNAVPQHAKLNQKIWKSLEDYILNTETTGNKLKVCVFTGPVLSKSDPDFVTPVNGEIVKLPVLFWKVVFFPKSDGKLYRVGFLMSQNKLLRENGIVEEHVKGIDEANLFMQFDDAATYQVNIPLIEKLTEIELPKAIDSYSNEKSLKLILEEIDIDPESKDISPYDNMGFRLTNLVL
jgi:endonuclease G, mitochondrial